MEKIFSDGLTEIRCHDGSQFISAMSIGVDFNQEMYALKLELENKEEGKSKDFSLATKKKEVSIDYFHDGNRDCIVDKSAANHLFHEGNPQLSLSDLPTQSLSARYQVKFEEQRGISSEQQNNNESSLNNSCILSISNPINQLENKDDKKSNDWDEDTTIKEATLKKKIKKQKSGRPLKKNFMKAEKQKLMKEFEIEDVYGSTFSSENYQLLITAILIFGDQKTNGNMYVVKKGSGDDKSLDFSVKLEQHSTTEKKRMWLTYYKISRILNSVSRKLMESLYNMFQQFIEMKQKDNPRLQQPAQQQQLPKLIITNQPSANLFIVQSSRVEPKEDDFLSQHLVSKESIKELFDSSDFLRKIYNEKGYSLFTDNCFGYQSQSQNSDSADKNIRQFDYQDIEKTLLVSSKITKADFILILFSCAMCDYFNLLSPYYQSLCNLL